jgi:hypothetical protein
LFLYRPVGSSQYEIPFGNSLVQFLCRLVDSMKNLHQKVKNNFEKKKKTEQNVMKGMDIVFFWERRAKAIIVIPFVFVL